jgi:hypothetical protein
MNDSDKVLTYEEAKQLCMKAFDGGAIYGSESTRYGVNARAYDWDHWLKKNEGLFKPKPTVEDLLREFALAVCKDDALTIREGVVEKFAARLQLAESEDA